MKESVSESGRQWPLQFLLLLLPLSLLLPLFPFLCFTALVLALVFFFRCSIK